MLVEEVLQRLNKKVAARKEDIAHSLAKGQCGDFAAYRDKCGEYRGLSSLGEMAKEVLREIHGEEDD